MKYECIKILFCDNCIDTKTVKDYEYVEEVTCDSVRSYVLWCDTKSSINRLRKTQILGKETRTPEVRNLADKYLF